MAIAVCVDDVLFFGPDETEMKKVIDELQANGHELKLEKEGSSDTCAPVASWKSIRMLMITALRQKWVTRQTDFSNAFVQAPMERDVHIALPGMFADTSAIASKDL